MPLREAWNALEPSVYLTLFGWLAPMREGRTILQKFAESVDPKFAHPNYLAYVVLTPVKKITGHLMDICYLEKILTEVDRLKTVRVNKLRHMTTAYVARQYLETLVWASSRTQDRKEDEELSGEHIRELGGVTKILVNLPREYQRWNKYYKQQGKSITPKTNENNEPDNDSDEEQQAHPFDVSQAIHPTFKQAIYPKTFAKKPKGLTSPLRLDESWDPLIVTQGLMKKQYDIRLSDMNKEPIESYRLGKKIEKNARGNTAGKTKKTSEETDEDSQEEQRPQKRQKTTNKKSNNRNAEKTVHNRNNKEENEKNHENEENEQQTSDQEDHNETPDETAQILKDIICKNLKKHMQTTTRCTPQVINLANELTQDLTEYVTNHRPTECFIEMQDIEDRQTRTSTRSKK
jgi:hypothetical protein